MEDTPWARLHSELSDSFPAERLLVGSDIPEKYSEDFTEEAARRPGVVVVPLSTAEVSAVVRAAVKTGTSLTVRVAGTNIGGLAIPPEGGCVVDLASMNKVLEVNPADMYTLIEPGVTWAQLKAHLEGQGIALRMGYPLSPPDTSIVANCLLDGLGNLSLLHGSMGDWIGGMEVVLPDGEVARVGAAGVSDIWFGRGPMPGLLDLFIGWQSATGIVTKMAFQLWPLPPFRKRYFVLCYERNGAFEAMRELARVGGCDDVGGLSWTTGKMLFGVEHPLERDPSEPEFFLYMDITGHTEKELNLREEIVSNVLERQRMQGRGFESPMDIQTLLKLNPQFGKFADFPTRLEFLVDHPGGGLSWVGTYGPMSRFELFADRALGIMDRYAVPPTVVSRPMKGGHFGVLRFIALFDKTSQEQRDRVRAMNREISAAGFDLGFITYKTPPWAMEIAASKMDPGYARLLKQIRALLDPAGVMAPHSLKFEPGRPGHERSAPPAPDREKEPSK